MKDILFSKNFVFNSFCFDKYNYTDNRAGSPWHYLALMEQGTSKIVSKEKTIDIKEGEAFYIPKDLSYQSFWYSDTNIKFISLGFELFPESVQRQYALQKIKCDDNIKALIKAVPTKGEITSLHIGTFYSALATVLPLMEYLPTDPNLQIIEKAKQFIWDNPHYSISEVAKHCMISESALYNAFKRQGKTPNELRQKILCEKAVIMLTTTRASVQEISDKLGFSSTSYFRKILHRHKNKTPMEIRKSFTAI